MPVDPLVRLARIPRRPPRSDLLLAGALALWGVLEAVLGTGPGTTPERIAFALLVSAPLIFRRRAPFAVLAFISAVTVLRALTADAPESGTMPFPSLLIGIFSVALYGRTTPVAVGGGLMAIAAMAVALNSPYNSGTPSAGNMAILVFFCAGTWAAGWLVRRRAEQARLAVAESGELARTAVGEERARIARELHDVVAHSVSIIAVQAGAAEQLIDSDPEQARRHVNAVRRTAREAMSEMRRLLGVLRADETRYSPTPGLSRLDDLVEEVRTAGVPVELAEHGERAQLTPGVDLVAYRVVQESLTNVRKHAPDAATTVTLTYRPRELEVEIANAASSSRPSTNGQRGGGHGVIGMRERVALFGGRFQAAPTDEGGFRVHALLPLEEAS